MVSHPNRSKKKAKEVAVEAPALTCFKGFDLQMKCRGFQFKEGETFTHDGKVEACESGFHSCENPLDVFDYYPPGSSVYAEVEASGSIARHDADSKVASGKLHIRARLTLPDYIGRAIAWVTAHCEPSNAAHVDGRQKASSATGESSASSATGESSASSATGESSASSATGYRSASSATGYRSASLTTGWYGKSEITSQAEGKPLHAVAIAAGGEGKARAPVGSAIVLVERSEKDGAILHIRSSKVGDNGIKADIWYSLKGGEFVEAA